MKHDQHLQTWSLIERQDWSWSIDDLMASLLLDVTLFVQQKLIVWDFSPRPSPRLRRPPARSPAKPWLRSSDHTMRRTFTVWGNHLVRDGYAGKLWIQPCSRVYFWYTDIIYFPEATLEMSLSDLMKGYLRGFLSLCWHDTCYTFPCH